MGYRIIDNISILDAYLVEIPESTVEAQQITALGVPGVRYVEPNHKVSPSSVTYPNDELFPYQWHYSQIRLPQAWSVTTGNNSVRVAVLDSGVDAYHPELAPRLDFDYGYNFVDDNYDFQDYDGHGTHVAGTIGAVTNDNSGVAGVMWDVDILPVKVLNGGIGTVWDLVDGILYAAGLDQPGRPYNPYSADIINLSLGGREYSDSLAAAIEWAANEAILVAATGNESGAVNYPAAYPEVIAVGAVDYNYPNTPNLAEYSNYGCELDVVAPGGDNSVDSDGDGYVDGIWSLWLDPPVWHRIEGTSMPAPHVTGVIGLVLSNGIPKNQVRQILRDTSMQLDDEVFSFYFGHGLVNAYWAVNAVDRLQILVGTIEEDTIHAVAETSVGPKGGDYHLSSVPKGEYYVFACKSVSVMVIVRNERAAVPWEGSPLNPRRCYRRQANEARPICTMAFAGYGNHRNSTGGIEEYRK